MTDEQQNSQETLVEEAPAQTPDAQEGVSPEADTPQPATQTAVAVEPNKGGSFTWGTGRRKKAVARVRIRPGTGNYTINKRNIEEYFASLRDRNTIAEPLEAIEATGAWDVWVNVKGGGSTGQAGAIALGLARALAKALPDRESTLRDKGLLTRDARMPERKKPGQPGARKRFQFSKR